MVEGFLSQASVAGFIFNQEQINRDALQHGFALPKLRSLMAVMQRAAAMLRNGSSSHMGADTDMHPAKNVRAGYK
jgi:hypothetical protein